MSRPIVRPPQAPTYSVELAVESPNIGVIVVAEIPGFISFDRAREFALTTTGKTIRAAWISAGDAEMLTHHQFAAEAGVNVGVALIVAQNVTEYLPGTVTTIEINREQEA